MSEALHSYGAVFCRVQFFGMIVEPLMIAELKIDHFIERYHEKMGSTIPHGKNIFDYGVFIPTNGLTFYKFSDD